MQADIARPADPVWPAQRRDDAELRPDEVVADLRRQSRERERRGYDGHNRRSSLVTMHRLKLRRSRRWWNRIAAAWVRRDP